MFVGVQSIRGTASDTLGNGIGSILLGLLCLSCGGSDLVSVASRVGSRPVAVGVISAAVNVLSGVGLLAADPPGGVAESNRTCSSTSSGLANCESPKDRKRRRGC